MSFVNRIWSTNCRGKLGFLVKPFSCGLLLFVCKCSYDPFQGQLPSIRFVLKCCYTLALHLLPANIQLLQTTLDQQQSQTFVDYMYEIMLPIAAVPDRKASAGGNTGQALVIGQSCGKRIRVFSINSTSVTSARYSAAASRITALRRGGSSTLSISRYGSREQPVTSLTRRLLTATQ